VCLVSARTIKRGLLALAAALTVSTGLAGCTLPDVGMSPGLTEEAATSSATPTASPAAPAAVVPAGATPDRPAGDLDTGSITHSVTAGDRAVVIDYWTDQEATSWTAAGNKTVQVAAHIEGGTASQQVKVTRFLATSDDGTTRTTVTEDRGEFVLTPPFSYTTALAVAPSAADATGLTLYVQIELLVETKPRSDEWFRQTVLDSIQLPLLQEEAP
jgi:hypothetical protein